MSTTPYFRFRWSHVSRPHRMAVKIYNHFMRFVPFSIKYGLGKKLRNKKHPYCLIENGSVIVQIGAPRDILSSGRSRGMYFSLFAGNHGKVVIIEPDRESVKHFELALKKHGIRNVILCQTGAWSAKNTLKFFIDDSHPAANLTEEAAKRAYNEKRLKNFRCVEIAVDTVDRILAGHHIEHVDLISITTNGAEKEILAGMKNTIAKGLPYIALARTGNDYAEMMASLGYDFYAHDDRGFTFKQKS